MHHSGAGVEYIEAFSCAARTREEHVKPAMAVTVRGGRFWVRAPLVARGEMADVAAGANVPAARCPCVLVVKHVGGVIQGQAHDGLPPAGCQGIA